MLKSRKRVCFSHQSALGVALVSILAGCAAETGNTAQNTNISNRASDLGSYGMSRSCTNGVCTKTITSSLTAALADDAAYQAQCQTLHSSAQTSDPLQNNSSTESASAPTCIDASTASSPRTSGIGFQPPAVTSEARLCVFTLPDGSSKSVDLGSLGAGAAEVSQDVKSVCSKAGVQCLTDTSTANSIKVTVVAQNTPQNTLVSDGEFISICHALSYPTSFAFKFSCVKKATCASEEREYASGEYKQ